MHSHRLAIKRFTLSAILCVWLSLGSKTSALPPKTTLKIATENTDLFDPELSFFKRGNPKVKEVALSIDDGPHILFAPKILETLRKDHAHATFFVVGKKVAEHPELVRQMLVDGNEVGNHSMTHPRLNTLPIDQVKKELSGCQDAVYKATGTIMTLMRPPGERYTDDVLKIAKQMHLLTVAVNIGVSDFILVGDTSWTRGKPGYAEHVQAIPKQVFKQLKNGGIIDLHDMPTTADALDRIIKGIRERGYKIVTVSQLLAHLPRR